MSNTLEEIKARLDIADVISEYIPLKQAGVNFKGLCPFHREKTPSFFVSTEKQIWHCFGCGKGGSLFDFIMEIEGAEFPEALRILAEKAGVEIKQYDKKLVSQNTKLLDICKLSAKFYHKTLMESSLAGPARKYLRERGLKKKIIEDFQIGFSPDKWDVLEKFLTKRGYSLQDIKLAGLISQSQKGKYYDRFRNRIIFPINDLHGQTIGFTSRILPGAENEDQIAKYINTQETPIYSKGRVLYGLDQAKMVAKQLDKIILVEGNMDVLACHQHGNKNVVCTSGTALTKEQIKLLQRYTKTIVLAFDMDSAGQEATQRSIDILLQEENLDIKIIQISSGKDPDECISKTPKIWDQALKKPLPIIDYYFQSIFKDKDLAQSDQKKQAVKEILKIIIKLGDPVEKGIWLKRLSDQSGIAETSLREALSKAKVYKNKTVITTKDEKVKKYSQEEKAEQILLGLIVKFPKIGKEWESKLILDMLVSDQARDLAKNIKNWYNKDKKLDQESLRKQIVDEKLKYYLDYLLFAIAKDFIEPRKPIKDKEVLKEIKSVFRLLKKHYLIQKIHKLTFELKQAEADNDLKKIDTVIKRLSTLSNELGICEKI